MPQLEDVGVGIKGGDGADALVVEVVAIGLGHQLVDHLGGKIDAEGLVDTRGALRIGAAEPTRRSRRAQARGYAAERPDPPPSARGR